jgi:hypothetical protein
MNSAKATIEELTGDPGQTLATEGGEIADGENASRRQIGEKRVATR